MLPGFRLLAITVAVAASVLMFGLGAAAFLRATHEEFAAAPLRSLQTPASSFVTETPTLAVLQVEPLPAEPPSAETPASQPVDPAPVLAPAPAPAPTPLVTEAETATPEDEAAIPRIVIPDPSPIPLTDAITTASIEAQPQPAAKPAAAPASAIETKAVARKRAAMRAKARARARAHHRRRVVRPAPPAPVEQSFFPLFDPPSATTAASSPAVASTLPPRR